MFRSAHFLACSAGLALSAAVPAHAAPDSSTPTHSTPAHSTLSEELSSEDSVFAGNFVAVGLGGIYGPDYIGSNDYSLTAMPAVGGRIGGVTFAPTGSGMAVDVIPDPWSKKIGFSLGPSVSYSRNRATKVADPIVQKLGKLKSQIMAGANGGVSIRRVLNPYDSLSFSAEADWDITGHSKGMTWGPSVSYLTPLSKGIATSFGAFAEYGDNNYMNYNFSVSAAGAAASGLPEFNAKGGWDNVGGYALVGFDLDGNLLNGGPAIVVGGGYNKLLGDAQRTPITSIRGTAAQWFGGVGLAWVF